MRISLCTSVNQAEIAAKAGFGYVEENVQNLLMAEAPDEAFAPLLKATQKALLPTIAANCFLPGSLKCTGLKQRTLQSRMPTRHNSKINVN